MNRNSIKQKKAEDILSSCLFCKNWERFYLQKMFALRTIVFILFLCYNYLSCMSHRNFAVALAWSCGPVAPVELSAGAFFTSAILYIFA